MRAFKAVAIFVGLAFLLTGSALVATTPAVPRFSGTIDIAGRHVPLPTGEWLLAGSAHDSAGPAEARPYGAIETAVLFKLAGTTVEDFITIRANALPVTGSWGRHSLAWSMAGAGADKASWVVPPIGIDR